MKYYVFHDEQGAITGNGSTHDGTIPDHAVECGQHQHNNLDAFKVDVACPTPFLIERNLMEVAELKFTSGLARALSEIRAQRAPILDALNGIASRAMRSGDLITAKAADAAAQDLLDITEYPPLRGASTYEAMKVAVVARYRELANAAPITVKSAFRALSG